jgi:hypothetical protein
VFESPSAGGLEARARRLERQQDTAVDKTTGDDVLELGLLERVETGVRVVDDEDLGLDIRHAANGEIVGVLLAVEGDIHDRRVAGIVVV